VGRGITIGRNGGLYPGWRRSPDELARVRALVHQLHCQQGLSIRQVRRALMDFHVLRSVGSIQADLSNFECDLCAATPAAPEPAASQGRPEAYAWQ
jgi:hypothetical protein